MVISLFGVKMRDDVDLDEEARLTALLYDELRTTPGFISWDTYLAAEGHVLGVVRFNSRASLQAWRDNQTHRSAWRRAAEFFEAFWVQNCETFREYAWEQGRHYERDLESGFRTSDHVGSGSITPPGG
jgi:heme-degrading monooxygenase HmoA